MSSAERDRSLAETLAAGLIWSYRAYLYEHPLEPLSGDRQPVPPDGVTCVLVDRENVEWIRDWQGPSRVRRFRRFLNRGDVGVYALANGEVIRYGWAALNLPGRGLVRTHDPIEVGDALLHRAYTREDYRRRGVASYALAYLMTFLHEQYLHRGLQRVCAIVLADNLIPQRLLTKFGFRKTQHIKLVRLLGTVFLYWSCAISLDAIVAPGKLRVRFKVPEIWWDLRTPIAEFRRDKEVAP